MNNITNIKINYMILEQILRVTDTYEKLCDECKSFHGFYLEAIFKQAKTGNINSLLIGDAWDSAVEFIEKLTGLPEKYWLGKDRIKLGIRCKNKELNYDGKSIDNVDISTSVVDIVDDINISAKKLYLQQLENPLHINHEDIYTKITGLEVTGGPNKDKEDKEIKIIKDLYSLSGLLKILLINMSTFGEIEFKTNQCSKWEPYIRLTKIKKDVFDINGVKTQEPIVCSQKTQQGIGYSPKFIEIRKGLVQTIIKNIFNNLV